MKGRPPMIPRLEILERRVTELEEAVLELTERLKIPAAEPKLYSQQFTQWPKANGS